MVFVLLEDDDEEEIDRELSLASLQLLSDEDKDEAIGRRRSRG